MAVRDGSRHCARGSDSAWVGVYDDFVADAAVATITLLFCALLYTDDPFDRVWPWACVGLAVVFLWGLPHELTTLYVLGILVASEWPSVPAWCGLALGVLVTHTNAWLQVQFSIVVASVVVFKHVMDAAILLTSVVSFLTLVVIGVVLYVRPTRKLSTPDLPPDTYASESMLVM